MGCKLSILICTIPERANLFTELFNKLNVQATGRSVQIIYDDAPRGTITIGAKRNDLLKQAIGEYVCFIDDDDDISHDYIEQILKAINMQPDCIGFQIACNMDGVKSLAASSLKYEWSENIDGYKYVRSIYHKTPVKRDIALQCMFPDKSFGEDYEYSMRLKPLLKNEVFINKILYYYNFKYENPKTKYGLKD
jgi:glycosyltransferase involved in cell wall biosynthesis